MKHIGNLEITEKNANLYGGLIEVTGCLLFYGSAKLDALQTVGGDLHVYGSAKLDAPALQTVGGEDVSGGKIKFAKTPVWTAICTPNMLRIGCQSHAWDDWIEMSDEEISKLDYRASEIAKKYRAKLLAIREELRGK